MQNNLDDKTAYRFANLTRDMNIPEVRRTPTQANLLWFLRCGAISNQTHRNIDAVIDIARKYS